LLLAGLALFTVDTALGGLGLGTLTAAVLTGAGPGGAVRRPPPRPARRPTAGRPRRALVPGVLGGDPHGQPARAPPRARGHAGAAGRARRGAQHAQPGRDRR